LSLRAFVADDNLKFYALTFLEGAVSFAQDRAIVYKHILALVPLNEAITFTGVEPFNGSGFSY